MGRERVLRDRVNRLRELMQEATPPESPAGPAPSQTASEEADAWRRFHQFAANDPLPAFDDSDDAIAMRTINRIATTYGWTGEIQRYLDQCRASSLSVLTPVQLSELRDRMVTLEDCAHHGFSPPDCPAAF